MRRRSRHSASVRAGSGQANMGFGGQPAAQVGRQNSGPMTSPQLPPGAGQRQVRLMSDCDQRVTINNIVVASNGDCAVSLPACRARMRMAACMIGPQWRAMQHVQHLGTARLFVLRLEGFRLCAAVAAPAAGVASPGARLRQGPGVACGVCRRAPGSGAGAAASRAASPAGSAGAYHLTHLCSDMIRQSSTVSCGV